MSEEFPQSPPEPPVSAPTPQAPPQSYPAPVFDRPKKNNKLIWIILGGVVGLSCLVGLVCVVTGALGIGAVFAEKAPIEQVLDAFMKDMQAKDIDKAYALFSPRSQRNVPISELENMAAGNNYFLFEGYQSVTVDQLNIQATVNPNQNLPQGQVATIEGRVHYAGDFMGRVEAVLEKVNGEWRLFNIFITVPPEKIPD